MKNFDKFKAELTKINSAQEYLDFKEDFEVTCDYCKYKEEYNCNEIYNSNCSEGFKEWAELELKGCSECLCNKCPTGKGHYCWHCKECLKKESREIIVKCESFYNRMRDEVM